MSFVFIFEKCVCLSDNKLPHVVVSASIRTFYGIHSGGVLLRPVSKICAVFN